MGWIGTPRYSWPPGPPGPPLKLRCYPHTGPVLGSVHGSCSRSALGGPLRGVAIPFRGMSVLVVEPNVEQRARRADVLVLTPAARGATDLSLPTDTAVEGATVGAPLLRVVLLKDLHRHWHLGASTGLRGHSLTLPAHLCPGPNLKGRWPGKWPAAVTVQALRECEADSEAGALATGGWAAKDLRVLHFGDDHNGVLGVSELPVTRRELVGSSWQARESVSGCALRARDSKAAGGRHTGGAVSDSSCGPARISESLPAFWRMDELKRDTARPGGRQGLEGAGASVL